MDKRESFAVVDTESGNAVSFFETRPEAEDAIRAIVQDQPSQGEHLVLVCYDELGVAVDAVDASVLLAV